jgi:hypothetical protein
VRGVGFGIRHVCRGGRACSYLWCVRFVGSSLLHIKACARRARSVADACVFVQIGTTKGTGGDIIILEEAAYVDPGFFYETVAPLLIVGNTSLLCISTLTSEVNFYTRLMRMVDSSTNRPMFSCLKIQLACDDCIANGTAVDCVHLLHLVPRWQSSERHLRLKTVMQDRPDLIQSELSGIAFDSMQQAFRVCDVDYMFKGFLDPTPVSGGAAVARSENITDFFPVEVPVSRFVAELSVFVDPAAGGPQSDYAIVSVVRCQGIMQVLCA